MEYICSVLIYSALNLNHYTKMVKKLLNKTTWHCLLLLVLLSPAISFGQSSIWTNPITGTNPNTSNPYTTGDVKDANITVSGIGRGAGAAGSNANNRYNANSWNTANIDLTAYFEFTLTPATGYKINLASFVYSSQVSSTNISGFAFRSSLDNYAANIGTPTSGTSATTVTIDLSAAAYQNRTSAITFRLYAWGSSAASTTTFSVNDFTFNGTVDSLNPPSVTTALASAITNTTATAGGEVTSDNGNAVTARGVVWATTTAPTVALTTKTTDGTGTGTFTSSLSSLSANTRYYYRAYATNLYNATSYGTEYNFYTAAIVPSAPTLGNPQQTSIDVTVNANGNNATTTYSIRVNGSQYVQANGTLGASPVYQTAANWGTKTITGLTAGTTYTVDVAAQNTDASLTTAYGSSASIDTLAATAPSLTLTASSLAFGNVCINATASGSFTFEGANIVGTTDITVPAISGFSYSLTENGTYTDTLTITNFSGASVTVYVKFAPTAVQSYGGTVNVAGTGANATAQFNITTSGAGINTLATITTVTSATNITGASGTISATYTTGCYTPTALEFEYATASFANGTGTVIAASTTAAGGYSAVLSGLAPSTRYYFKAKITDASGTYYGFQSSFVTNAIDAPVATAATSVATNSFTANWNAVSNVTNYQLDLSTSPTFGTGTRATDLFFSEYVEGSSNNKYIEIYNGTGNTVDLSNYKLSYYANGGATASIEVQLTGALLDGQTKVYKNASATVYAGTAENNSAVNFNGDDALALIKISTGAYVDIIGSIGFDPGSAWTSGSFSTLDKTLRRKATVTSGLTTNPATSFPTLSTEWEVSATDDVTNLGSHTFSSWTPSYVTGYQNASVTGTTFNASTNIADNATYYYRVRSVLGNSISVNSNVISLTTPIGNVTWTVPSGQSTATWVPAATPTNDINVTLNANYDTAVNGNITAKNLTLNNGYNLAIAPNTTVTVYGNIVNNAQPNNFVVENNGSLVQYGSGTATGAITVNKNSNALYLLDYTLWSSPVNGTQTLQDFSPNTVSSRFYEYKYALNSSNTMVEAYFHVDATSTFTPANGYLIRMPNQNATTGYNEGTTAITYNGLFIGTPNTGTITKAMNTGGNRYTGTGNPYASPISVVDFFAQNASVLDPSSGIYLWRKKNSSASASYATLTLAGFTASGATFGGEDQQSYFGSDNTLWTLAPGQGFIVRTSASASNPVVTFTNSMRRSASASGQAFFRQAGNSKSRYWMSLKGTNGAAAQMAVAYMGGATTGIDAGYDGTRYNDNKISLYTIAENTELAIQARPAFEANDNVKVGYVAETAGTYTLTLDNKDGVFANGQDVFVYDTAEGLVYNLANGGYTFTTEAGTFNTRFEILYTTQALGTDTVIDANAVAVYKSGSTIYANSGTAIINAVTVYDIRGRKLYENNNVAANTTTISTLSAAQEVIIVQLKTNKGTVSKKIVF